MKLLPSLFTVTCGGLCPGLNDVVQNIVLTLVSYGVPEDNILGIR
jgi:6-phosphofructokinase 1